MAPQAARMASKRQFPFAVRRPPFAQFVVVALHQSLVLLDIRFHRPNTPTAMQLTIREAASYFGVNEQTFRRWISQRGLPVHEVYERIYLNPLELWEWAVEQGIPVSRGLLDTARRSPEELPRLADLLPVGRA